MPTLPPYDPFPPDPSTVPAVEGLVKRLREMEKDDHERGCQGRCYGCSCGYDERKDKLISESAARIEQLEAALEKYRQAVRVDVLMEGPRFSGSNWQRLKEAWEYDSALLKDRSS